MPSYIAPISVNEKRTCGPGGRKAGLLAYLDEEKRKLIELHYFDGYPIWKVALKMGIDESTFHRYQTAILILLAHRLGL